MATTQIVRQSDYPLVEPPPQQVSTRWATEDYEGRGEDFRSWLFSQIYWSNIGTNGNGKNSSVAQAMAETCLKQLEVTYDLRQVMDQSLIIEAWQAQKFAWYAMLDKSFSSLSAVLEKALAKAPESERYDLLFWVEYLLPALEYLGSPVEEVLTIPEKYSKARAAVPTLRRIWRGLDNKYRAEMKLHRTREGVYWEMGAIRSDLFPDDGTAMEDYKRRWYQGVPPEELHEFGEQLHSIINMITSDIAVRPFREKLQEMSGRVDADRPAQGWILQTRAGEWLFIESSGPKQTTMIANRLSGLVEEPGITDPMGIITRINEWFRSTERRKQHFDLDLEKQSLEPTTREEAPELIMVESIGEAARIEIAKALPYLIQTTSLLVPIYEICPVFPNVVDATLQRFGLSLDFPLPIKERISLEIIPNALVKLYQDELKQIARQILPQKMNFQILVTPHPANGHVTVCLEIENVT